MILDAAKVIIRSGLFRFIESKKEVIVNKNIINYIGACIIACSLFACESTSGSGGGGGKNTDIVIKDDMLSFGTDDLLLKYKQPSQINVAIKNVYNNPKNTKYNITVVAFDDSNKVIDNKLIQVKDGVITDTGEANLDLATGSSITVGHLEFYVNKIKQAKTVNFYLANRLLSFLDDNQIVQGSNTGTLSILNVDPKEPHHTIMIKVKDNDPKVHITSPSDGKCEVYYHHNCDIDYKVDNASSVEQQNNQALTPFAIIADGTSIGASSPQLQIFSCGSEASVSFVKPNDVFDQDGSYTTSLVYCPAAQEHTINFTELKTSYLELPTTDHHDANPAIIRNVRFHINGFQPDSLSQANRLQDGAMNDIIAQVMLDNDTSQTDNLTLSLNKPKIEFAGDVSVHAGGNVSFGLKVSGHVLDAITIKNTSFKSPTGITISGNDVTADAAGDYSGFLINTKKTLAPGSYEVEFVDSDTYQTTGVLHLTVKDASDVDFSPKQVNFLCNSHNAITGKCNGQADKSFYLVVSSKTKGEAIYLSGRAEITKILLDPNDKTSGVSCNISNKECKCEFSETNDKCIFIIKQQYSYTLNNKTIQINSIDGASLGEVTKSVVDFVNKAPVNQMTIDTDFNSKNMPSLKLLKSASIFNDEISMVGDSDAVITDGLLTVANVSTKTSQISDTINNFTGQTYAGDFAKQLADKWKLQYQYTISKTQVGIDCNFSGLTRSEDGEYGTEKVECINTTTSKAVPVVFEYKFGNHFHLTFDKVEAL